MRGAEIIYGDSAAAKVIRAMLRPATALFGAAVAIRNSLYNSKKLRIYRAEIPVISVGNISVGGTGKTPFTAWLAAELTRLGQSPAIVLRGYGDDEHLVHQHLNPGVPVIVDVLRIRGVEIAEREGASVALLDDGFQHRRLARDADVVLVSAERWRESMPLLPAGELREPLSALARAAIIVITRKSASREKALSVEKAIRNRFRNSATAIAYLAPDKLRDREGNENPLSILDGQPVLAISAVGNNAAFETQLRALGANVDFRAFPDHHAFSAREVDRLADESATFKFTVCTLKDAVKLWPKWPAAARPLWYVSQALVLESGAGALDDLISRVTSPQRNKPQPGGEASPLDSIP